MTVRTVWQGGATEEGTIQEKFPKYWKEANFFFFLNKERTFLRFLLEVTTRKYLPLYKRL